ncbi:hypothetical protein D3C72_2366210 [compost metagenome]
MFPFQFLFDRFKFIMQLNEGLLGQVDYRMILIIGKGKAKEGRKMLEKRSFDH